MDYSDSAKTVSSSFEMSLATASFTLVSSTSFPSAGNQLQVLKTIRGLLDWLRQVNCFANGYQINDLSYIQRERSQLC